MENHNPTSSISDYYKRFWRQFYREIRRAVWEAVIAIIAIVAVVFLQFYYGWINREQGVLSALQNVVPAAVIALAYVVRHLIKTPWRLDVEREGEIESGLVAIDELKGQIEKFSSEATRPKFTIAAQVYGIEETDEDDRYILSIELENNGARPALDVECQALIAEEDVSQEPKIVDTSVGAEVEVNISFRLQAEMRCTSLNEPPLFIICALKYKDAITGKPYPQIFFRKWAGLKNGEVQSVHPLTISERDSLKVRLKSYLPEFITESNQNVGSIPNSKMD